MSAALPNYQRWHGLGLDVSLPHPLPGSLLITPNLNEAARFLQLLDENENEFTFQTFGDEKHRKDNALARILPGTFDQHAATLTALNRRGAGVFVMVQCGDGIGRKNSSVKRIRAIFQEDDGDGTDLPMEPHVVVESSPGKHHRYILADGLAPEDYHGVMARIISDYGSDPNAKDIARVLRLPGFFHLKNRDEPHKVRIVHESGALPYTRERILAAFPPASAVTPNVQKPATGDYTSAIPITPETQRDLRSALASLRSDDRALWIDIGIALKPLGEIGRGLWLEWSQTSDKYDPIDAGRVWDSLCPESITYASVFNAAQKNGWANPASQAQDGNRADYAALTETVPTPPGVILLPSDHFSYSASATIIFAILAESKKMFLRGSAIVEMLERGHGPELSIMRPSALQSRLDRYGGRVMSHVVVDGRVALKSKRCPKQTAEVLLESLEAREILPPIVLIAAAPLLVEHEGRAKTLQQGYHEGVGGVLVTGGDIPQDVPINNAVRDLRGLLADFDFQTPADESRALAMLITPAMKMGVLLQGPTPIDVAEADQSQAGKTLRQNITRLIYRDKGYVVTRRAGGVGSLDESISAALISGRAFIAMDNFRGKVDSQYLEAIVTWPDMVSARVPNRGEVMVDARRVSFAITSNGVETTRDLANRSCITRIRKRPKGYQWHAWPEGGIEAHVETKQSHYLGCVHAVVRHWFAAGKPTSNNIAHDMRAWAEPLDWIVRNVFGAAPLMDGHAGAQEHVSNPALVWIRAVCIAIERSGRLGVELSASAIWETCQDDGIDMPRARGEMDEQAGARYVGQLMAKIYRDVEGDVTVVDGYEITRHVRTEWSERDRKDVVIRRYAILRTVRTVVTASTKIQESLRGTDHCPHTPHCPQTVICQKCAGDGCQWCRSAQCKPD